MREFQDRSGESWALIKRQDTDNTKLAIFIHGFLGSHLTTWGNLPTLIRNHADSDSISAEWDYVFLGYDTRNVETYLDIAELICSEWNKARTASRPYNRTYTKLALFGHSLGTLGIRQLLCAWSIQPDGMLDAVHSVTLFGTPLNGSPYAKFMKSLLGYKIADALRPQNPQLRMLKIWLKSVYSKNPWKPVRIILGQDDKIVGFQYAELIEWPGDDRPEYTVLNHRELVKPLSWNNSKVVDYICNALR